MQEQLLILGSYSHALYAQNCILYALYMYMSALGPSCLET